jgi:Beta-galactosidase
MKSFSFAAAATYRCMVSRGLLSVRSFLKAISGRFQSLPEVRFFLVTLLSPLVLAGQVSAESSKMIPRGVFSLGPGAEPADAQVLASPAVDGISVRQPWSNLERSPGVFDWSFLDSEISRAAKAGKMVLVRILTEGPAVPKWVYAKGVQTFSFEDPNQYHRQKTGQLVVYWDRTFLSDKRAMIKAAGEHLSGNPAVRVVAVVGASSRGGDWNVPHTRPDMAQWQSIGYTSERLIDVVKDDIDVTGQSFPRQCLSLAVGINGRLDPDPYYVGRAATKYGRSRYPGRFIIQKNGLSAVTPLPGSPNLGKFELLWEFHPDIAGQMLWFSYGDQTYRNNGKQPGDAETVLRRAIDVGLAYQMQYMEIYQQDILHFPGVAHYAHEALTK